MNATALPAIGHNHPPRDSIIAAEASFDVISSYLNDNPTIDDAEGAKTATAMINTTTGLLKDMEAERDSLVRPLNEDVKLINSEFKFVREPLEKLLDAMKSRLDAWLAKEDMTRHEELEAAKAEMAAARENLDQADRDEAEAEDYGAAVIKTRQAIERLNEAERRLRAAMENDRARVVDDAGGRTLSRRTVETLVVEDPVAAVIDIIAHGGLPEKLGAAILTAARDFRKANDALPAGVIAQVSKKV